MRILVACEFSGVVRDAFRARGHDAVSCDLFPSEWPGPHILGEVRDILQDGWDLMIAHPPGTFLANSSAKHLYVGGRRENGAHGDRWANLGHAAAFFLDMIRAPIPRIAVENPIMLGHVRRLFDIPGAVADDPALAVRASRDQGDVPLAQGPAAADPDVGRRGPGGAGAPRAAGAGALAKPEPHLSGHRRGDGRAVGERGGGGIVTRSAREALHCRRMMRRRMAMGQSNADQNEFWNSEPGQNWVRYQADLDAISREVGDLLLEACEAREGEMALDVGCGAGATTLALARAVAPSGRVHGVDISSPLLARASAWRDELGIENVTFELADAQEHAFAPAGFDLVASRFGLMFFADPVAAFRNLRSALRSGGRIAFVAWAGPDDNPWFAWPHRIAAARLGSVPATPPDAPGPMAFQDLERVKAILSNAGFSRCDGRAVPLDLHHPGGLEAILKLVTIVGPVARVVREKNGTEEDRAAIAEEVGARFEQFRTSDGIRIPARVNVFTARAP